MIKTRLGTVPLPEPYGRALEHQHIYGLTYSQAQEVVAMLNGEGSTTTIEALCALDTAYSNKTGYEQESLRDLLISLGKPDLPMETDFAIIECNDGNVVQVSRHLLRKRFHFFDDYLTQFPDERTIRLDFNKLEVCATVYPFDDFKLVDCLKCIEFLNPKSPLYVFQYAMTDTPTEAILRFASLCSDEDKRQVLHGNHKPGGGFGNAFLAPIFHADHANTGYSRIDYKNLTGAFSHLPSYLAAIFGEFMVDGEADEEVRELVRPEFDRLMLTCDFSSSLESDLPQCESMECVMEATLELLERE